MSGWRRARFERTPTKNWFCISAVCAHTHVLARVDTRMSTHIQLDAYDVDIIQQELLQIMCSKPQWDLAFRRKIIWYFSLILLCQMLLLSARVNPNMLTPYTLYLTNFLPSYCTGYLSIIDRHHLASSATDTDWRTATKNWFTTIWGKCLGPDRRSSRITSKNTICAWRML